VGFFFFQVVSLGEVFTRARRGTGFDAAEFEESLVV
jgi:hypothetical protein